MEQREALFQYAALYYPSKEELKKGKKAKVIIEPTTILAKNAQVASMIVIRELPEEYTEKLENVEIVIRPF